VLSGVARGCGAVEWGLAYYSDGGGVLYSAENLVGLSSRWGLGWSVGCGGVGDRRVCLHRSTAWAEIAIR